MIKRLFNFQGGIKPDSHKNESAGFPIRPAPLPARLTVPLRQNARSVARCIVEPGQHVLKGQRIGEAQDFLGTAVHAPSSGTVIEIADHPMAHASGLTTRCIVIETDGQDQAVEMTPFDHANTDRLTTLGYLRDAGVVGMGGAAFPSHVKLGSGTGIDTLVLNGAECEPWITCDDRLMRERADAILRGAKILRELIGAPRIVVGIEDNKPEAIAAMQSAATAIGDKIEIVAVPTRYPAGGEKQLIRVLTGIEIPQGKLGSAYGVQCFNVGTAHAVYRAINFGEPVLSRVVTLTGNVAHPGNYETLIGTPIDTLLPLVEPQADTDRYILGGPMMGLALSDLSVPIAKGSNCIIASSPTLFPPAPPERPCIRCTACASACPAGLQPFELYWYSRSRNFGKAQEYKLFDCIECGSCAFVCPSHIPLVDYYRYAKSEIWARERDTKASSEARERFEFRNYRQEREKAEKAARLAAKAAETKARMAQEGSAPESADDAKKALIAAAMERAKQQKAVTKPKNTEALDPATQAEIAEIDARRAQAGTTADASVPDLSAAQLNDPSEDAAAASSTTPADDHVQPR
jgi:electron transport complex protein RnfC